MFEKKRIRYNEETGVREVETYNPMKETLGKVKDCTMDFIEEQGLTISLMAGTGLILWLIGVNQGMDAVNKSMLDGYENDGYNRTGLHVFKKKMSFAEWFDYLDHMYNTKGGKKLKNINKYLKEKGFID